MLYDKIAPYLRAEPTTDCHTYRQICLAISAALGLGRITGKQHKWLADQVRNGMRPYMLNLEDWLQSKGLLATLAHLSPDDRYRQIQAYRHRWLKHLCEEYELQEVFDKVATHLLKQGSRSEGQVSRAYRGDDGKMCAVGCLLKDGQYSPGLEGRHSRHELVQAALKGSGVNLTQTMQCMLQELQSCHDHAPISKWPETLRSIAARYSLDDKVIP